MLSTLPYDILDVIFNVASNKNLFFVDKQCNLICIKYIHICDTCNKIIKIFNKDLWLTEENDFKCHTHLLKIKPHKILDIKIIDGKKFYNSMMCLRKIDGQARIYAKFKACDNKNKMFLKLGNGNKNIIHIDSSMLGKFILTKKQLYLDLKTYADIKYLSGGTFKLQITVSNELKVFFSYT
jgi:hypothetical protein